MPRCEPRDRHYQPKERRWKRQRGTARLQRPTLAARGGREAAQPGRADARRARADLRGLVQACQPRACSQATPTSAIPATTSAASRRQTYPTRPTESFSRHGARGATARTSSRRWPKHVKTCTFRWSRPKRRQAPETSTGAFPISRSRAHTHRRHGHPLQTVPSAGLIERPQEKNRVDALR